MAKIKKIKLPNDSTEYEFEGSVTDISDTTSNIDSITTDYPDVSASDKASTLFGKIKKFLSDLKSKKQDNVTGAASTITSSNLTANRILQSDANGKVAASGYEFDLGTHQTDTAHLMCEYYGKLQYRRESELSVDYANTSKTFIKTDIPANANLNDYRTPGRYTCGSNNTVGTLSNCPTGQAFVMDVMQISGNFVIQFLTTFNSYDTSIYIRAYEDWTPTWNTWRPLYFNGVCDVSNNTKTTFAYSKAGLSDTTWVAAWNKYELRAIAKSFFVTGFAQANAYYKATRLGIAAGSETMLCVTDKGNRIWACSAGSDARIKTNIKDTEINALDIITKIKLRSFDYIDEKYGTHKEIGYVAQEVKDIMPDIVFQVPLDSEEEKAKYETDWLYQIEDKPLIPYLVKSIQELTDIVDKQQQQIDELKNRVVALKEVIEY